MVAPFMRYIRRSKEIAYEEGILSLFVLFFWFVTNRAGNACRYIVDRILDPLYFRHSLRTLRDDQDRESSLSDYLDTTFQFNGWGFYRSIRPQQIRSELRKLTEEVEEIDPDIIVEIGTAEGGTFYLWSRYFSPDQLISIDLPGGIHGGGYSPQKMKFFSSFSQSNMAFIRANSHDPSVRHKVGEITEEEKVDFLLIDGDHRYEGVKKDWELYKDIVRSGGIVAFHDIVEHPYHPDCEVNRLWKEIKEKYETQEIISEPDQNWGGIGIVYL
jgi:cephalosporin hydroxylase